jgi:hypothetical protein
MPDVGSPVATVLVLLLLVVMLSFAFGTQRNIRVGNNRLRWLQSGLPRLGARATLRWLGSSAVQLDVVDPVEPFREATVLVVLEPRDVPLLWLVARSRGRRDVVIVRGNLRRAPTLDLEATDPSAWIRASDVDDLEGWSPVEFESNVEARANGAIDHGDVQAASRFWREISDRGAIVWRLSIRRTVPHIEIHVRPEGMSTGSADRLIDPIVELAEELARP